MNKVTLDVQPDLIKAQASEQFTNKVKITFPLLRTYPAVNANGDTYDYDKTKENYGTITNGYINLEHSQWINIGTITDSSFEEGDEGVIKCEAVLWKSVLDEFDISVEDIKEGIYQVSMEVFFSDYYIMHGEERIDLPDAEEYQEYRGQSYEGKEVKRVIIPTEYSGAALTETAADKTLDIEKVVASKLENKGISKEDFQELLEIKKEEAQQDMFKTFETEQEFLEFKEELIDDIATELKEDEEFIAEASKGKIEIEEVVTMFQEAGIEDAEELEDVVAKFNELEQEYAEYKQEVAREKKINERKATLAESGVDFDKLGASENELADMTEDAFNIVLATFEQGTEKATASQDKKDKGFVPQVNIDEDEDELDTKSMIDAL